MGYRKFRATHLFNGTTFTEKDKVLVTDREGTVVDITDSADAGDDIRDFDGILSPAFINTHCHLELSHMKGVIPKATGLVEFLTRVIKERFYLPEIIVKAMMLAEDELYTSGTIAVADICNSPDSIPIKNSSRISWKNLVEVIGFSDQPESRLAYAKQVLSKFTDSSRDTGDYSCLVPHAPYSVSEKLFHLLDKTSGILTSIHNQESKAENELYLHKQGALFELYRNLNIDPAFFEPSGKTSVQTYLPWLTHSAHVLLVHNTYTSQQDLDFIRDLGRQTGQQFFFCVCLRANQYIESANPPVELFLRNACSVTIGTDSYASNDSLNMTDEMRAIQMAYPEIKSEEIFKWATRNGAKALQMEDQLGSFEKGKRPGIVFTEGVEGNRLTAASRSCRIL